MARIDPDRLLGDLYALRAFGAYKTGVHRPTYSEIDMKARHWLVGRMEAAGLSAEIDGIGNIIGRTPATGPKLLMGSHAETQPHAGWLDGALGVVYAIEVARAISEDPDCTDCGIDPAAWADEEGHFLSFIGSRSFVGDVSEAEIDGVTNKYDGTPLRDALKAAGLAGRPRVTAEPGRHIGYFEAHIEQGDSLEASGLTIGVVTSVVAIWQYRVVATGVQNHAGTTRMAIRRDAGRALVRLAHAIDETFPGVAADRSVWTVGDMRFEPGAPSIVPGRAEMLFQFRDADMDQLERFEATLQELVARIDASDSCELRLEVVSKTRPRLMDPRFQDALEAAARHHAPDKHIRMPSAAGHDAQILANIMPAGMLFVPSIGGISHHWTENTADEDIVLGCQVLASAAAEILKAAKAG